MHTAEKKTLNKCKIIILNAATSIPLLYVYIMQYICRMFKYILQSYYH